MSNIPSATRDTSQPRRAAENPILTPDMVRPSRPDLVRIYYGAADGVTAVADLSLEQILAGMSWA